MKVVLGHSVYIQSKQVIKGFRRKTAVSTILMGAGAGGK
jgi:hypothetical protein